MTKELTLPVVPLKPDLQLLIAPPPVQRQAATTFVAELAQRGPVQVLDGGNRFDVLTLNRALRQRGHPLYSALERVQVARAFTCYQMVTLLEQSSSRGLPTLILNLLSTFADENAPLPERFRLLESALGQLRAAARLAPVLLILHPRPEDDPFLERIREELTSIWVFKDPGQPQQLSLL
jgi:hypothetical protein